MEFFDSKECEWADIRLHIAGAGVLKFTGISWGVKQEKEYVRQAGDEPAGINRGNREYPCEITVKRGALKDINKAARLAGGRDILDISLPVTVTYAAAPGRAQQVVKIKAVEITEFQEKWTQGDKQQEVTLPALALGIEEIS